MRFLSRSLRLAALVCMVPGLSLLAGPVKLDSDLQLIADPPAE